MSKALQARPCRDCGTRITGWQRAGYCSECRKKYCRYCVAPLEPDRLRADAVGYCLPCSRANTVERREKLQSLAHPKCDLCGEAMTPGIKYARCAPCSHRVYVVRRLLLLKAEPRPCQDCGREMPAGRIAPRCTACHRRHTQRLPSQREKCAMCGQRSRRLGTPYCSPCGVVYSSWSRRYDAGDPSARMLKPKRKRRQWQENP